jgi:hypothetical protein
MACGRVDEALVSAANNGGAVQRELDRFRRRLRHHRALDDRFYSHTFPFT